VADFDAGCSRSREVGFVRKLAIFTDQPKKYTGRGAALYGTGWKARIRKLRTVK
jgi:hypothetical protein